jgi:hypothetical protein
MYKNVAQIFEMLNKKLLYIEGVIRWIIFKDDMLSLIIDT